MTPSITAGERSELGAHLARCRGSQGRWFQVRCVADALHDFVARRFVTTTLLVATVLIGAGSLLH